MRRRSNIASAGIAIKPCQICAQLKEEFYLCSRNHSTCDDCKFIRKAESRLPPSTIRSSLPPHWDLPRPGPPPSDSDEKKLADILEINCKSCHAVVEVIPVSFSRTALKTLIRQDSGSSGGEVDQNLAIDTPGAPSTSSTSMELYNDEGLREELDDLQKQLATACSALMAVRGDLDEVIYTSEKLVWDVDMMRGGVTYVYVNFDSVLKRREVRMEEKVCDIPIVFMVRMRMVSQGERRVPYLGLFVGLEPREGRQHSPLKKLIVLRAHNAYGKVIKELALRTFEKGVSVHSCFDLAKKFDGSLCGYPDFLRKDRIMRPDGLKDGRLCLSLQIEPLLKTTAK